MSSDPEDGQVLSEEDDQSQADDLEFTVGNPQKKARKTQTQNAEDSTVVPYGLFSVLQGIASKAGVSNEVAEQRAAEASKCMVAARNSLLQGDSCAAMSEASKACQAANSQEVSYAGAMKHSVVHKVEAGGKLEFTAEGMHLDTEISEKSHYFNVVKDSNGRFPQLQSVEYLPGFKRDLDFGKFSEGGALLAIFRPGGNLEYNEFTKTHLFKLLPKQESAMLFALRPLVISGPLPSCDGTSPVAKKIVMIENGAAATAAAGVGTAAASKPEKRVNICLKSFSSMYVVPIDTRADNPEKQFESIAKLLEPLYTSTMNEIKKSSENVNKQLFTPGQDMFYDKFHFEQTIMEYALNNLRNSEKYPVFYGFMVQPIASIKKLTAASDATHYMNQQGVMRSVSELALTLAQEGSPPSICENIRVMEFTVLQKTKSRTTGEHSARVHKPSVWLPVDVFTFLRMMYPKFAEGIQTENADYKSWMKYSELKSVINVLSKTTIIPKPGCIVANDSAYYSTSVGAENTGGLEELFKNIFNVPPQKIKVSLTEVGDQFKKIAENSGASEAQKQVLLAVSGVMQTFALYTNPKLLDSDEELPDLTLFKSDSLAAGFPRVVNMIEGIIAPYEGDSGKPENLKLSGFFDFQDPDEAFPARNRFVIARRLLLTAIVCQKSVPLSEVVRNYFRMEILPEGTSDQIAWDHREKQMVLISQACSFFVGMVKNIFALIKDLIKEINEANKEPGKVIPIKKMVNAVSGFDADDLHMMSQSIFDSLVGLNKKIITTRYVHQFSDKAYFDLLTCVAHEFSNSTTNETLESIIKRVTDDGGPNDEMKTRLKDYLKTLIVRTYDSLPREETADVRKRTFDDMSEDGVKEAIDKAIASAETAFEKTKDLGLNPNAQSELETAATAVYETIEGSGMSGASKRTALRKLPEWIKKIAPKPKA